MSPIDYSKTKIYKIQCKNKSVQDVFYGHCSKLSNVKYYLKRDIENGKDTYICNTIRENGGIEKWDIEIMESYTDCKNKEQADSRVTMIKSQNNSEKTIQNNPTTIHMNTLNPENPGLFNCIVCNKKFTLKTNLYRHNKYRCVKTKSTNPINETELEIIKMQLEEHAEKIKRLEEHAEKIKEHAEKIKRLEEQIRVMSTQHNNNIVNNTENNIIFELGNERFDQVLTDEQKLQILNQKYTSIEYFIKEYHCNRVYPEFQNVIIKSITKSHCDVYSTEDKKYIAKDLKNTIEELVDYRIRDLRIMLEETPNVPEDTNKAIMDLLEMVSHEKYKKKKYKIIKITMYSEFRRYQPTLQDANTYYIHSNKMNIMERKTDLFKVFFHNHVLLP